MMAAWSEVKISELEGAMRIDSEYYQPDYLRYATTVAHGDRMGDILNEVIHPVEIKRIYEDQGIQILLAQNIRHNELDFSTAVFMPYSVAPMLARNRLKYGDVVVTRSGANYGDSAPYLGDPQNIYACADCLVLRPKQGIDGRYLSTYLNSKIGRSLIKRGQYGAGQPHVAPTHIREIRVPRLGKIESEICQIVNKAKEKRLASITLYSKAGRLFLSEFGLGDLDLSPALFYERSFSDTLF
jgi:type I restriction enzyme S subunit